MSKLEDLKQAHLYVDTTIKNLRLIHDPDEYSPDGPLDESIAESIKSLKVTLLELERCIGREVMNQPYDYEL